MATVVSVKELARKTEYEVGKKRKPVRELVCVLSDDAITGAPIQELDIATAAGVDLGTTHPYYTSYRVRKLTMTEGWQDSPYHVHLLLEYDVVTANELLSPTSRSAEWSFESSPGEIAALTYYDGSTLRPLTNSAYDYFPGLTTQESLVAAKVTKNFASLPTSWISAQNHVNDSTYLGCPTHSVKVGRVGTQVVREEYGGAVVAYWQATADLHYRQSGHNLQLPDIGWNFLDGGQKRRAMVFDFENSEWVASPNPVGLNGSGGITLGVPAILDRRVNPEADFTTLFGTPPTTPVA